MKLVLSGDAFLDALNIRDGVFAPLDGFMDEATYRRVVAEARLASGAPWGIPITLDVPDSRKDEARRAESIELLAPEEDGGAPIARLEISSLFETRADDVAAVYGVADAAHPGVAMEMRRSRLRAGGRLIFARDLRIPRSAHYREPAEIRAEFQRRRWTTLIGFQTRNAVHRAHEYLQRMALEFGDGLFIHPLTGWKKDGDASVSDIVAAYGVMQEEFFPRERVLFGVLETAMRYAGPREALFHACIRKNYGCTHFIVGRDHAGVGGYYDKYAAQRFCALFDDLGIEILPLAGPFHCDLCDGIVTERSCGHPSTAPSAVREISGTMIRDFLERGEAPPSYAMRPEVAAAILAARADHR